MHDKFGINLFLIVYLLKVKDKKNSKLAYFEKTKRS